jgi:hypothetical protein
MTHSATHQASETGERSAIENKNDFEQKAPSPLDAADYGEWLKSEESLSGR